MVFRCIDERHEDRAMTATAQLPLSGAELWHELAQQFRVDSIRATAEAGSGHPTSAMSAADLLSVLVAKHLRYDFGQPSHPNNDHLILSKGHAAPLLYAMFKAVGAIDDHDLLTLRKLHSPLEGHPSPRLPWVEIATGSLGFGVPVGAGIALAAKTVDRRPYRVWVIAGDSEMAEGSVWEAFEHAAHWQLDNFTVLIDVNRLGQSGETMHGWDTFSYAKRARAFGWRALMIDGHNLGEIDDALREATESVGRPTVIVARTSKGRGVRAVENKPGWHGKPIDDAAAAVAELGGRRNLCISPALPPDAPPARTYDADETVLPRYDVGTNKATRRAYGEALAAVGRARMDVVAMDGEVSNSTFSGLFAEANPDRFFEMYVAEQQMIAAAIGFDKRGLVPFASAFAAFFSRAYDFIRMAAISRASIRIAGSHAGVVTGEDGPSQMALEDLAMFRAIHGSTVLYPSDANQTARLVELAADNSGVTYLRLTRADTDVIYDPDERFALGGSRLLHCSDYDHVTIAAAGITVHEALTAARVLRGIGINARVLDLYSVKPLDDEALRHSVDATNGRVVIVEDHWPEGGLGDAVLSSLSHSGIALHVATLAVRTMPGSGSPAQLLKEAQIDADAIVSAVRELIEASHR
jgi:transketolase